MVCVVCSRDRKHIAKGMCKSCYNRHSLSKDPARVARARATNMAWRLANPDRVRAVKRVWSIKRRYGLTATQYKSLLAGGCQICGSAKRLNIDHCHVTGKVRGCLCHNCNTMLGHAKDNPVILAKAIEYLKE